MWSKARAGARPVVGSEEAREGEEHQDGGEDKVIRSEVEMVAHQMRQHGAEGVGMEPRNMGREEV